MYGNKMINEAEVMGKWAPIIESTTGISDKSRIEWMSKYCHNHELYENNAYATYGAVNGMGITSFPGDPGTQNSFSGSVQGSGDKAHTLLPLAMQVAANTVGLDLVPVIPMPGPMGVLTYLDFVYGGGKLNEAGTDNNPATIKVDAGTATLVADTHYYIGDDTAGSTGDVLSVKYLGTSRVDGFAIFEMISSGTSTDGTAYVVGNSTTAPSIASVIEVAGWTIWTSSTPSAAGGTIAAAATNGAGLITTASLVKALEDHLTGFSGASFGSNDPYSRDQGESTQENVMNLTLFNKAVEAKTFQVAAAVTREQVQDLKQFGIDAVAQVEAVLANELTQSINKNILERLFKLGVTNHANIAKTQALSFDLKNTPFLHFFFSPSQYAIKSLDLKGASQ